MTPTRQHAAIRIQPRCWNYSTPRFEKLIIHEMLHPLFDPIEREHERMLQVDAWTVKHFNAALETTVDHIANVLYNINNEPS